eukprot:40634-Eustigmatos_ZCMA.PRE.1
MGGRHTVFSGRGWGVEGAGAVGCCFVRTTEIGLWGWGCGTSCGALRIYVCLQSSSACRSTFTAVP